MYTYVSPRIIEAHKIDSFVYTRTGVGILRQRVYHIYIYIYTVYTVTICIRIIYNGSCSPERLQSLGIRVGSVRIHEKCSKIKSDQSDCCCIAYIYIYIYTYCPPSRFSPETGQTVCIIS